MKLSTTFDGNKAMFFFSFSWQCTGTAQQVFEWGGAKEECVKENFLLNYFLFNLFLFLQKSGGAKAPPAPPSARSLV